jgi:NADH-quinone oxidoreductase subunit C
MADFKQLVEHYSKSYTIKDVREQKPSLAFLRVGKDEAVHLIRDLQETAGYTHLSFLTAIDWIEKGHFTLTYMLHNYAARHSIGVHVNIERQPAEMESIHQLWAQAATYQRELREMYGIRFPGSPRLDDDFCLEGWDDIPPMRREFDTVKYSQERFFDRPGRASEDPRAHMQQILYPTHKD